MKFRSFYLNVVFLNSFLIFSGVLLFLWGVFINTDAYESFINSFSDSQSLIIGIWIVFALLSFFLVPLGKFILSREYKRFKWKFSLFSFFLVSLPSLLVFFLGAAGTI